MSNLEQKKEIYDLLGGKLPTGAELEMARRAPHDADLAVLKNVLLNEGTLAAAEYEEQFLAELKGEPPPTVSLGERIRQIIKSREEAGERGGELFQR